ncbi:hypothetical protein [Azospirillum sp. sgz302134]
MHTAVPPDSVVLDGTAGVVLFGNDTPQGRRVHRIAAHCRAIAESTGTGPTDMASVLTQLAAYYIGSEYDVDANRALLADELVKVLRAKAVRAVEEVRLTGFQLPAGTIDAHAGLYRDGEGRWRHGAEAPLCAVFRGAGGYLRALARTLGTSPAELANDIVVVAGYYAGSSEPDSDRRSRLLGDLEAVFRQKLAESVDLGARDRAEMVDVPPLAGWRGGTELPETDPRRRHPPAPWLRPR